MHKTIAVIPGDGIWPEVVTQAVRILDRVATVFGHSFEYRHGLIWWAAYDVYQTHLPDETLQICQDADAILLGSIGGPTDEFHLPKWRDCERNSLLNIRKYFKFHANLRPIKVYPMLTNLSPIKEEIIKKWIDILFCRELNSDIYFGEHKSFEKDGVRVATDMAYYDEQEIRRIAHTAFRSAQSRRKKVTSVGKDNVLDVSRLWKTVVTEVSAQYPDVTLEHMLVDNCAMQLIRKPYEFDVILTGNMFGDILSDEASVLPGSLGLLPSASLNESGFGMYEPSGGSAPRHAGKDDINPIAQILSAAMMLRLSFGLQDEADAIERAIEQTIVAGFQTYDILQPGGTLVGTQKMWSEIISRISKN